MSFSQKIYFNDKPLILTTDKEQLINNNAEMAGFSSFSGASTDCFTGAVVQLEKPGVMGAIIADKFEDALLKKLHSLYNLIDAAGGIAYNEAGGILMIFRRGKWDLPKGKLDKGESIEECALREVCEETGLEHLTLNSKICDTYHIYNLKNEQILKRTAWYKMLGTSSDKLDPQKDEGILEARWVNERDLPPLAAKSYEAIREVLRLAGQKVEK